MAGLWIFPGSFDPATRGHEDLIRRAAALCRSLTAEACSALRRAKELHDELEAAYHPFVDFRALTRFEQKHLEKVFSA